MGAATNTWPTRETDPQRVAILAAARLLAGTPRRSTGVARENQVLRGQHAPKVTPLKRRIPS